MTPGDQRLVHGVLRAHPDLIHVVNTVHGGDWDGARQFLDELTTSSDRTFVVIALAEVDAGSTMLRAAAEHDPWAACVLARRCIRAAVAARGHGSAAVLSQQQIDEHRRHSIEAEQILTRTVARHPDFAEAWVARLTTGRRLGLDRSEARRRWQRVSQLAPDNFWAHTEMLQYWCPKWYGSWDDVEQFVGEAVAAAPAGSPLRALPAYVEIERWAQLEHPAAGEYFLGPGSMGRVWSAARESVGHPSYVETYGWPELEGVFGLIMCLGKQFPQADGHLQRLGDIAPDFPWSYLGDDPQHQLNLHRGDVARSLASMGRGRK